MIVILAKTVISAKIVFVARLKSFVFATLAAIVSPKGRPNVKLGVQIMLIKVHATVPTLDSQMIGLYPVQVIEQFKSIKSAATLNFNPKCIIQSCFFTLHLHFRTSTAQLLFCTGL